MRADMTEMMSASELFVLLKPRCIVSENVLEYKICYIPSPNFTLLHTLPGREGVWLSTHNTLAILLVNGGWKERA